MGNKNYKKTSLYDDSLGKLFWKSGMIGLIILAFAELIILFVCIYSGYDKQDTPVLLLLMWAFGMVFLYLRTILSFASASATSNHRNPMERQGRF